VIETEEEKRRKENEVRKGELIAVYNIIILYWVGRCRCTSENSNKYAWSNE
jgi:hypothetical protein